MIFSLQSDRFLASFTRSRYTPPILPSPMSTRYFMAMRCGRSKEQKIIPLSAPPETLLDEVAASSVCLIHTDQFTKHFADGERSKCNPQRVLFALDIPENATEVVVKELAIQKALPLFDTVYSSSDG